MRRSRLRRRVAVRTSSVVSVPLPSASNMLNAVRTSTSCCDSDAHTTPVASAMPATAAAPANPGHPSQDGLAGVALQARRAVRLWCGSEVHPAAARFLAATRKTGSTGKTHAVRAYCE